MGKSSFRFVRGMAWVAVFTLGLHGGVAAACSIQTIEECTRTNPQAAQEILLQELAKARTADTLGKVGLFYRGAPPPYRDFGKGLGYLQRATNAGNGHAAIALAEMYASGEGIAANPRRAVEVLEGATRLGPKGLAFRALGELYLDLGNETKAGDAFQQGAAHGDTHAKKALVALASMAPTQAVSPASGTADSGEVQVAATVSKGKVVPVPIVVPSTLGGRRLTLPVVIQIAYDSGFRREETLLAAVAMAVAESGLWSTARNWKPEWGYRPAGDRIGVIGPPSVWSADGRQIHSDRGIWQISSFWWPDVKDSAADDPVSAGRALFKLSRGGTDFSLWDSYRAGRAQKHYDNARDGWPPLRPFIKDFLSGGRTVGSTSVGPNSG